MAATSTVSDAPKDASDGVPAAGAAPIEWGTAGAPRVGESCSGDAFAVVVSAGAVVVSVIDGLGHGPEAAEASARAAQVIEAHAGEARTDLGALMLRCNNELKKTRGAVLSIASLAFADGALSWLAVGNVDGLIARADPSASPSRLSLLTRAGVVGYRLPLLRASSATLSHRDLLVLASDGIDGGFFEDLDAAGSAQENADRIYTRRRKTNDDSMVLVLRFLGGRR